MKLTHSFSHMCNVFTHMSKFWMHHLSKKSFDTLGHPRKTKVHDSGLQGPECLGGGRPVTLSTFPEGKLHQGLSNVSDALFLCPSHSDIDGHMQLLCTTAPFYSFLTRLSPYFSAGWRLSAETRAGLQRSHQIGLQVLHPGLLLERR